MPAVPPGDARQIDIVPCRDRAGPASRGVGLRLLRRVEVEPKDPGRVGKRFAHGAVLLASADVQPPIGLRSQVLTGNQHAIGPVGGVVPLEQEVNCPSRAVPAQVAVLPAAVPEGAEHVAHLAHDIIAALGLDLCPPRRVRARQVGVHLGVVARALDVQLDQARQLARRAQGPRRGRGPGRPLPLGPGRSSGSRRVHVHLGNGQRNRLLSALWVAPPELPPPRSERIVYLECLARHVAGPEQRAVWGIGWRTIRIGVCNQRGDRTARQLQFVQVGVVILPADERQALPFRMPGRRLVVGRAGNEWGQVAPIRLDDVQVLVSPTPRRKGDLRGAGPPGRGIVSGPVPRQRLPPALRVTDVEVQVAVAVGRVHVGMVPQEAPGDGPLVRRRPLTLGGQRRPFSRDQVDALERPRAPSVGTKDQRAATGGEGRIAILAGRVGQVGQRAGAEVEEIDVVIARPIGDKGEDRAARGGCGAGDGAGGRCSRRRGSRRLRAGRRGQWARCFLCGKGRGRRPHRRADRHRGQRRRRRRARRVPCGASSQPQARTRAEQEDPSERVEPGAIQGTGEPERAVTPGGAGTARSLGDLLRSDAQSHCLS